MDIGDALGTLGFGCCWARLCSVLGAVWDGWGKGIFPVLGFSGVREKQGII